MQGHFLNKDRQDFTGIVGNNCKGTIKFPDEGIKSFEYDEEEHKFFWDNRLTGEEWQKGKNVYNLRFIQNKNLSHRNSKINKNNETSNQKITKKTYLTSNSHSSVRSSN